MDTVRGYSAGNDGETTINYLSGTDSIDSTFTATGMGLFGSHFPKPERYEPLRTSVEGDYIPAGRQMYIMPGKTVSTTEIKAFSDYSRIFIVRPVTSIWYDPTEHVQRTYQSMGGDAFNISPETGELQAAPDIVYDPFYLWEGVKIHHVR